MCGNRVACEHRVRLPLYQHTAHKGECFVFCTYVVVCLRCDEKFLTWSGLVPMKYAGGFCRMADRLTNTIRTHKHSAPSLCFSRHTSQNYFTYSRFTTRSSFTTGTHTQNWGRLHTLHTKIEVCLSFWKPWFAASRVQHPGCSESQVSVWRLSLPLQSCWLGSESERNGGYGAGQSRGCGGWCVSQQKWRFNIWSLLDWVRHSCARLICALSLHSVKSLLVTVEAEKNRRNQRLHGNLSKAAAAVAQHICCALEIQYLSHNKILRLFAAASLLSSIK